jgi:hypothetical protein
MIILIILIALFFLYRYYKENVGMVYCKSTIDGRYYMVRDLANKQDAADLLSRIYKNMFFFSKKLLDNINRPHIYPYKIYIIQLNNNIKNIVLRESSPHQETTSYTVNKGEKMVLCLRTGETNILYKENIKNIFNTNLHNINLIMYVVLHEMAHIACPEYDHTELFKKIFNFLCKQAIDMGLYSKINFESNPEEYCGIVINDSII